MIWDVKSIAEVIRLSDDEKIISYLPLSHVAAQVHVVACHGSLIFKRLFAITPKLRSFLIL